MNASQIFKAAHALTKATIQAGDCYRVTFGAALRIVRSQPCQSATDRLMAAGGKEWIKGDHHRIYFQGEKLVSFDRKSQMVAAANAKIFFDVKKDAWSVEVMGYGLGKAATLEVKAAIEAAIKAI